MCCGRFRIFLGLNQPKGDSNQQRHSAVREHLAGGAHAMRDVRLEQRYQSSGIASMVRNHLSKAHVL
jgi:hypothetical protein